MGWSNNEDRRDHPSGSKRSAVFRSGERLAARDAGRPSEHESSGTPTTMPAIILPLRTPRLVLRDFVPGDFDAIHSYASDPDVTRFMFHGVRSAADTRD